ncbi:hypothetical protein CSV79_12945 [Sporosarcina sp. P13]|uniref:hypothetical protein n=1 Tax=Sporosarcina sp. P13 TaxID=2048263 RepID=UPI000C16E391|nr:hypothetical protein [Sporosarcina sp. P13]PIC63242.1 hypothetical protein CSV79_12945 [Sporosarcina sp. P13]
MTKNNIHLPNLSFIRHCSEEYKVSRGLYNTIDLFFYERGYQDVIERRRNILSYLDYLQNNKIHPDDRIRFESGALKESMDKYLLTIQDS